MTNQMIMQKGMALLRENLGLVEAERFVFNIKSEEPFDYTEWRKTQPFMQLTVAEMQKCTGDDIPFASFGLS